jgi:hypothetical protein
MVREARPLREEAAAPAVVLLPGRVAPGHRQEVQAMRRGLAVPVVSAADLLVLPAPVVHRS